VDPSGAGRADSMVPRFSSVPALAAASLVLAASPTTSFRRQRQFGCPCFSYSPHNHTLELGPRRTMRGG
jgi:hypothetical protein